MADPQDTKFRRHVRRLSPHFETEPMPTILSRGGLGLAGESGEAVDVIKKVVFHGKPLDDAMRKKLILELGDVRWYLEYLAMALDVSMTEIEAENIKKLEARYPDGWSLEAAAAVKSGE